jgi:hypothetical protein
MKMKKSAVLVVHRFGDFAGDAPVLQNCSREFTFGAGESRRH